MTGRGFVRAGRTCVETVPSVAVGAALALPVPSAMDAAKAPAPARARSAGVTWTLLSPSAPDQ